jgi:hypothetical protein
VTALDTTELEDDEPELIRIPIATFTATLARWAGLTGFKAGMMSLTFEVEPANKYDALPITDMQGYSFELVASRVKKARRVQPTMEWEWGADADG